MCDFVVLVPGLLSHLECATKFNYFGELLIGLLTGGRKFLNICIAVPSFCNKELQMQQKVHLGLPMKPCLSAAIQKSYLK